MIYLIKLNIAIALFHAAYMLLFTGDTFFRCRRAALIGAMVLSAVIPLVYVVMPAGVDVAGNAVAAAYAAEVLPMLTVTAEGGRAGADAADWVGLAWIVMAAYLAVSAVLAARLAWRVVSVVRLARHSRRVTVSGVEVRLIDGCGSAFSFMRWIFADAAMLGSVRAADVLSHERTHVEQWHTADVLLSELMCAVCWLNPAAWAMRRQVRINLEYLADERVLARGADARCYQYSLLALACPQERNIAISNNFNVLPLKKRIKMMNKKRTAPQKRAKYLLLLPMAVIMLAASNAESMARSGAGLSMPADNGGRPLVVIDGNVMESNAATGAADPLSQVNPADIESMTVLKDASATAIYGSLGADGVIVVKTKNGDAGISSNGNAGEAQAARPVEGLPAVTVNAAAAADTVHLVVEQLPEYVDRASGKKGVGALMEYLSRNIKYPRIAMKAGIDGRVMVKFVVNTDGTVSDITVFKSAAAGRTQQELDHVKAYKRDSGEPLVTVRDACAALDAEAVRVIGGTTWNPGRQKGKAVRVYFTLPVSFKLK